MTYIVTEREIDGERALVIIPGAGTTLREAWWRWTGLPIMDAALRNIAQGVVKPAEAAKYAESTLQTVTSEQVMTLLCPKLEGAGNRAPVHGSGASEAAGG